MKQQFRYHSLELVDRGQFGLVFAAFDRQTGNLVALKQLSQQKLSTSQFLKELRFLVTLDCPYIVTCHALEHYQNHRYLVMDYCEGGTLRNLINDSRKLAYAQSLQLVIDIVSGLEYAHSQGIVHRDIKPENILLELSDRSWLARIADFGIAKLHQDIHKTEGIGQTGSPAYMAPEQFYGHYSYGCDLYGVGIILFELIVGKRPFSGMPKDLEIAHLSKTAVIPQTLPFILRSLLTKSLQKIPSRRFANAGEMLKSLKLAKEIVTITHSNILLLSTPQDKAFKQLTVLAKESFSQEIDRIRATEQQLYLGRKNCLEGRIYLDNTLKEIINQWKIRLDGQIKTLDIRPQGCFATTNSSIYYLPRNTQTKEFEFVTNTFLPIVSLPTTKLITTISPQGHWLAMSYTTSKSQSSIFEILKLPNLVVKSRINWQLCDRVIALNRRYGIAVVGNERERKTNFYLFNRRGNWLGNFSLSLSLNLITFNPLFDNCLLAVEPNNPGTALLIVLEPLKVKRISIAIAPTLAISCQSGYLLSDTRGRIVVIRGEDYKTTQFQVLLEESESVTAIAVEKSQLFVTTQRSPGGNLYAFDFELGC